MTEVIVAPKGLAGVVVEDTVLSRVDGVKGELTYLGYNVDELVSCSFEEIVHLFLYGALPTQGQLDEITGNWLPHDPSQARYKRTWSKRPAITRWPRCGAVFPCCPGT